MADPNDPNDPRTKEHDERLPRGSVADVCDLAEAYACAALAELLQHGIGPQPLGSTRRPGACPRCMAIGPHECDEHEELDPRRPRALGKRHMDLADVLARVSAERAPPRRPSPRYDAPVENLDAERARRRERPLAEAMAKVVRLRETHASTRPRR